MTTPTSQNPRTTLIAGADYTEAISGQQLAVRLFWLMTMDSMPHDLALKSMNLFATQVMPQVRTEIDRTLAHRLDAATAPAGTQEARI